jgi:DNA replication and repair protein RecF
VSLYLAELRLSQFRSHAGARLAFDGRPVAIWGRNGAGKTSLIEAVSLLSPGRGLRRAAADEIGRKGQDRGWRIRARLATPGGVREVETGAAPNEPRGVRIDGKPAPQLDLARLAPVLWLVPGMDRLWTEGAEGRRRFLDRAALSFDPSHAEAALAYDRALRERNRLLREGSRDGLWYGALERELAAAGLRLARGREAALARLAQAQERADPAFPAAALAVTHPEGAAPPEDEAAFALALARGRRRDMMAGRGLIGPHRADLEAVWRDKGIAARDGSTGEQKALLVSLVLANARALAAAGAPPLLLLDEVAAHLDAGRRAALHDEICRLGVQAFLTGTEPSLFTGLAERAQCWEAVEADGVTTMHEREAP